MPGVWLQPLRQGKESIKWPWIDGGDSTHKMSAYNNRYHPSNRDQRQIDRMERETMVLYPTLQPNPVLPRRSPGFSGGRGMFPRGTGEQKGWESNPPGMNWNQREKKDLQHQASTDNKEKQPLTWQGEGSIERVLPEGHTEEHLTTLHPPSIEVTQPQRMKLYKSQQQRESTQTPHWLPSPRMNLTAWKNKKKVEKKKTVLGMPLPQKEYPRPPNNCTLPCPTSWTEPYRRLWINQAPPA